MNCPRCNNARVECVSPNYSHSPASFKCYACNVYGFGFDRTTPGKFASEQNGRELTAAGDASGALSRANAEAMRGLV